jgi:hypothetical protein
MYSDLKQEGCSLDFCECWSDSLKELMSAFRLQNSYLYSRRVIGMCLDQAVAYLKHCLSTCLEGPIETTETRSKAFPPTSPQTLI